MSPLEIILYIALGLFAAAMVGRTIYKFVKHKKNKTGEKNEKMEKNDNL